MSLLRSWLVAFALTLAFEAPIVARCYWRTEPRRLRLFGLFFFANLATHPAVWFIFPRLPLSYPKVVALSELWAFGLEIVFYHLAFPGSLRRAATASVIANAVSLCLGYVWLYFVGDF